MPSPRRKFRITDGGVQVGPVYRSESAAYAAVRRLAALLSQSTTVTVWVDEGSGWQRYEDVDLADVARRPMEGF